METLIHHQFSNFNLFLIYFNQFKYHVYYFRVVSKFLVSENSPHHQTSGPKDYFKKYKILQGRFSKVIFTGDQNPNSLYL